MFSAILAAAGVVLLVVGGERLYYDLSNTSQVTMTCEEFARAHPSALRLNITGCDVDYIGAGYREVDGRIRELFFPARPAGVPRTQPAPIVAATQDDSVLAIAQETIGGGRQPDHEQFLVMMLKIVTTLHASREIEGYARAGVLEVLRARRAISGLTVPVAPGAAVIDLHASPDMMGPALTAGAGAMLLLGALLLALRTTRRSAPESLPETPPGLAPRASMRGLLLLNLPPTAERTEIEEAPPLGSRAETMAAISDALPGLLFDERGRAVFERSGDSLSVDVGASEPVVTVIASAGGREGLEALGRLLRATRWRAYAPKTGRFVEHDTLDPPAGPAA